MGNQQIIESINASAIKTDIPRIDIGDTVAAHCRIVEGNKERIQVFTGIVISRSGRGINEMITIRRIVEEMGVERILPMNSPRVAKFEVIRRGNSRRAKLYYLRERAGKSRRISDRRRGLKHVGGEVVPSNN
jgi:large subunit ribosomal protein L19